MTSRTVASCGSGKSRSRRSRYAAMFRLTTTPPSDASIVSNVSRLLVTTPGSLSRMHSYNLEEHHTNKLLHYKHSMEYKGKHNSYATFINKIQGDVS
jgi:hypothetical protein